MKRTVIPLIALLAVVPVAAASAQGQGGALDPSFGTGGRIEAYSLQYTGAMVLRPDGKIVVAGFCCENRESPVPELAIAGYDQSGSQNFGNQLDAARGSWATAAVLQPDGKIVVAGIYEGGLLARFNADGSLDQSFGSDGISSAGLSEFAPSSVILQPGGKIVVVGTTNAFLPYSGDPSQPPEFALARFDQNGSLDSTFGSNGLVTTSFGGSDYVNAAAQQADGKIVVAGFRGFVASGGGSYDEGVLARYNPDGSIDTSLKIVGGRIVDSVLVQPNGKILVGDFDPGLNNSGELRRYNPDGTPDSSFTSNPAPTSALALEPDGKIVAAGGGIMRFNADGTPDPSFGGVETTTGLVRVPSFGAVTIAVQPDGKIVAAGGDRHGVALVRILPDSSQTLVVKRRGRARGTIVSNPLGITCRRPHGRRKPQLHGTCSQLFAQGSTVQLVAQNAHGSILTWGGACAGRRRSCTVTMNGDRTVVAAFTRKR